MSRSFAPPPQTPPPINLAPTPRGRTQRPPRECDHLAHCYCFESPPPSVGRGQAESEGIVLDVYAETVDPASALGDSKLCLQ
jgi:hypothetical protein